MTFRVSPPRLRPNRSLAPVLPRSSVVGRQTFYCPPRSMPRSQMWSTFIYLCAVPLWRRFGRVHQRQCRRRGAALKSRGRGGGDIFFLFFPFFSFPPCRRLRFGGRRQERRAGERAKGRTSGERARAREFLLLSPSFRVLRRPSRPFASWPLCSTPSCRRVYHCMHRFVSATPPRARPFIGIRMLFEEFLAGNRAILPLSSKSSGALRLVSRSFRLLLPPSSLLPSSLQPPARKRSLSARLASPGVGAATAGLAPARARPSLRGGGAPWGSRRLSGRCGGGGAGGVVAVQEGRKKTLMLLQGRRSTRTKTRT